MNVEKLNQLRIKMHKQFVNRQPADEKTVIFRVGAASGIENVKQLLLALIDLVSDKSDNALVLSDVTFDGGVKVAECGEEKFFPDVTESDAAALVNQYFGEEA